MASKLSSILVKLGLIPIRKLDQAFQNQVINGGTLDSALLELGLIREKDLIRVLVEASDLPSIQLGDFTLEDSRALVAIFPQKLALRYQVIPVTRVGEQVGVLVNAEFDKNKIEEIGFMLGVSLIARVVPEPRLLAFASKIYGFELEERQNRILGRLGPPVAYPETFVKPWISQDPIAPAAASPEATAPEGPTAGETPTTSDHDVTPVPEFNYVERQISPNILVPTISRERITGEQERAVQPVQEKKSPAEYDSIETSEEGEDGLHDAVTRPGFTFPEHKTHHSPFSESGPIGPLPEGLPRYENDDPEFNDSGTVRQVIGEPVSNEDEAQGIPQIPRIEDAMTEPMGSSDASIPMRDERLPSDTTQTDAISYEAPAPVLEAPAPKPAFIPAPKPTPKPASAMGPRDKLVSFDGSPISLNEFTDLIVAATSRDDVLIAFLRYCANYAQYLFLFTVDGDAATGHFAIYRGQVDQHKVRNYLISLDFDSVLQKAAQNITTFGVYTPSEGNQFLLDHLSLSPPVHIMAIPLMVGSRTVGLVLGTHQLAQSPTAMGELVAASGLLSQGLMRLIKQRKKSRKARAELELSPVPEVSPEPELSPVPEVFPTREVTPYTAITVPIPTHLEQQNSFVEEIIALIDQLEHLSIQQDSLDLRSAQALKNLGDRTLEVLHFYFPGILTYRETSDMSRMPPPSQHGPLMHFMVDWGLPVVPVLIDLIDSENPQIRMYATYLFLEIRFPDILFRIAEKLFDPEPSVRDVAARVILSYEGHREYAEITSNLRGFLGHPDPSMQKNTVDALGRMRDKHSIEAILQLLPSASTEIAGNMIRALRLITLRDFGSQLERWQSWWALNSQRHRVLWLIEGLRQNDEELRRDAIDELVRIVGETMDYDPEASMEFRESSVRRWVSWWEQKGRVQLI
ncbi:hypothetical protein KJ975_13900 [Myxococcota bacterium]|nr:hypothetical protein [Myxococcota bacterium]